MLWTPVPIEAVMEGWGQKPPQLRERQLPGGGSVLTDSSSGQELVFRLQHTDPLAYLRAEYAPGQAWVAPPPGQDQKLRD
jgi:hypothetical protein